MIIYRNFPHQCPIFTLCFFLFSFFIFLYLFSHIKMIFYSECWFFFSLFYFLFPLSSPPLHSLFWYISVCFSCFILYGFNVTCNFRHYDFATISFVLLHIILLYIPLWLSESEHVFAWEYNFRVAVLLWMVH